MALRLASTAYPRDPERWGYRLEDWYDLSQDVLAHLWAKQVDPTDSEAERWLVDSFDGKAKYSTWAYQVASNLVKDHIKAQRSAARDPNHGIEEDSDHRIQMVDTSQIDLAVPVDDLDLRLDLEQAISQLSPQERLVIEHDLEDRQGETGLSNPSVYRTAAHKKLRVLLSEYA
jgi:RNA polymerase sigma factor (sigma-70 family)